MNKLYQKSVNDANQVRASAKKGTLMAFGRETLTDTLVIKVVRGRTTENNLQDIKS